jgi:hypothetical protein
VSQLSTAPREERMTCCTSGKRRPEQITLTRSSWQPYRRAPAAAGLRGVTFQPVNGPQARSRPPTGSTPYLAPKPFPNWRAIADRDALLY